MSRNTDDTQLVTILLVVVGLFVVFPVLFMGFGMMGFGSMMGGMWGGGMWGGGMWGDGTTSSWAFVGLAMQLLFFAVVIGGGYLVYRAVTGSESSADPAIEELRGAYARGELTDEEYEQRREALERDRK